MVAAIPVEREFLAYDAPGATPHVAKNGYAITWLFSGESSPGTEQTLGYVVIEPGQKNPLHAHPNCEEVLYLLEGELQHSFEEATFHLKPGDAIRVPAGVKHDARCVSEQAARMIICYSVPDREIVNYD